MIKQENLFEIYRTIKGVNVMTNTLQKLNKKDRDDQLYNFHILLEGLEKILLYEIENYQIKYQKNITKNKLSIMEQLKKDYERKM